MTKDYRKEWGVIEAIRELVQNCLDNEENDSNYEFIDQETIAIRTMDYILPLSTFALGESINKGDTTIGGFGEGYKLALLVLEREGLHPTIRFGNYSVTCGFEFNQIMELDTFFITIDEVATYYDSTTFTFEFDPNRFEELQHKVTVFSDNPLVLEGHVDIIEDRAGDLLVDGLFICNENAFKYGYNFSPEAIQLGSDRAIANPLGMAYETSKYWATTVNNGATQEHLDLVMDMMLKDVLDVQKIDIYLHTWQRVLLADVFRESHGDIRIESTYSSGSYGGFRVNSNTFNTLCGGGIKRQLEDHEKDGAPYRVLKDFLITNKKHMRSKARKNLQQLIDQSKKWYVNF